MTQLKAVLNEVASKELKEVAQELQISECEVLQKGLAIMRYYSQARAEDRDASLMIKTGNIVRKLVVD